MKYTMITAVLTTAWSALAGPINYSDDFESYTAGASYSAPYTTNWPDLPGADHRYPVNTTQHHSGSNSLLLENGYGTWQFAESHDFGQEVQGTDANPLVVSAWLYVNSTATRKTADVYIELAKDDTAPGASGTARNALSVAWPYSVRSSVDTAAYLFDGVNWNKTGTTIPTANTWNQLIVTIKSNTIDVSVGGATSSGWTRTYAGAFDQINLRHVSSAGGGFWLDDLSVTGGEIVPVPEPATLAWLGLGTVGLVRSRGRRP